MPSSYPITGAKMKIKNIGSSNFMLEDKRGNFVTLEPSFTIDVEDNVGRKLLRLYSSSLEEIKPVIKKVEKVEPKVEKKEEEKEVKNEENIVVEEVSRETKKKRKKNVSNNAK